MRKIPEAEINELIYHIIAISMILHRSAISIAEQLELPDNIIYDLRQKSPRNAMISECNCVECVKKDEL